MSVAQEYEKKIGFYLEKVNNFPLHRDLKVLQNWQSNRLMETHKQLYAQKRFKPAMIFFKDQLYSGNNTLDRNMNILRALPIMCRTMPDNVLDIVVDAARLQILSLELDSILLHFLANNPDIESLTFEQWRNAYHMCNNRAERTLQIDIIEKLGLALSNLVKKPYINTLLSVSKFPAKLAGYQTLHTFVCEGFNAFTYMEQPEEFVATIVNTERNLSMQWFTQYQA